LTARTGHALRVVLEVFFGVGKREDVLAATTGSPVAT